MEDDLEPRLKSIEKRFKSVENTMLECSEEITFLKSKLASIDNKYAVSVREKKKEKGFSAEDILKDLLGGEVVLVDNKLVRRNPAIQEPPQTQLPSND